ncbi:uncharacterized protein MELLADRAFT_94410 [Melampsora larici-populina 98AG31]|uniref:Uncharacterized protein n=1 Tax=Melampsora larici-populina (strain 98AG31 / pathotype 3-4-7) TaxID=747676 RepID=F4RBF0_MELLP|nr:uncharacterized protein MELLADRAFT_94410 [Melampsora larici-populina 98AG31]EGG10370.1 hypothetical protein MELLADRAFT_94410 [Melampsora larici-populina 98AG31]
MIKLHPGVYGFSIYNFYTPYKFNPIYQHVTTQLVPDIRPEPFEWIAYSVNYVPPQCPDAASMPTRRSPPTWAPLPAQPQRPLEPGRLPETVTLGSLQFENQGLGSQQSGVGENGPGRYQPPSQQQVLVPKMAQGAPPDDHTVLQMGSGAPFPSSAVWVPNGELIDGRRTYTHDISHPPWKSKDDYDSMIDWRYPRVISNDRIAVLFNGVCTAALNLNGLDHVSDPLPWCRDGTNPVREALASAEFNLHVLREDKLSLSSGAEDNCLQHLLQDSDKEELTPGHSVERLVTHHQTLRGSAAQPTNKSPSTPTPSSVTASTSATERPPGVRELICKSSPVKHRGDLADLSVARRRLNTDQDKGDEEVDELEDDEMPLLGSVNPATPAGVCRSVSFPQRATNPVIITPAPSRHPFPRLTYPGASITTRNGAPMTATSATTPHAPSQPERRLPSPTMTRSTNRTDHTRLPTPITTSKTSRDLPEPGGLGEASSPTSKKSDGRGSSNRMRWGEPGDLDTLWLSHLVSFDPFSAGKKEAQERFRACLHHLKASLIPLPHLYVFALTKRDIWHIQTHANTMDQFTNLSTTKYT